MKTVWKDQDRAADVTLNPDIEADLGSLSVDAPVMKWSFSKILLLHLMALKVTEYSWQ